MKERIEHILVSILAGVLGAWMVFSGLHVGQANALQAIDWGQAAAGMIIFLIGAWQFFRGTLAPGGESLPVYRWTEYLILVSIMVMMGLYFTVSGANARDWDSVLTGLMALGVAIWAVIRKFPGRGPQA